MFVYHENDEEKKDITLRGVNKELYDQFNEYRLKWGFSAGQAIDSLLFTAMRQPWRMQGVRTRKTFQHPGVKPEIISDLDYLKVAKRDLTSAGEKTMFLFRNIIDLVFDKDVDGATLAKHVKAISHSNATYLGNVPKLIRLGLVRKKYDYIHPIDKDNLKDITIRNVSSKIYDELISMAKSEGKNAGEMVSKYLSDILPFIEVQDVVQNLEDREFLVVKHEVDLTITNEDLEILGDRGVIFYNVSNITFSNTIKQDFFLKNVLKIIKCHEVNLPSTIPKLIALSRTIQCKINFI
ncbi:MAG: hypothetical protein JXA54_08210 [Candidatus Heimdallarchaeota archaeon]|nr:hypothetical protein [Candidatus Heimdallarchaeota archaeon]